MRISKLLIALSVILTSCAKIEIKDIPIRWDMGPEGAYESHLISDTEAVIPKAQWDAERPGYACLSEDDFGWLKATILKACGELKGLCDTKTKASMGRFFDRADKIAARTRRNR